METSPIPTVQPSLRMSWKSNRLLLSLHLFLLLWLPILQISLWNHCNCHQGFLNCFLCWNNYLSVYHSWTHDSFLKIIACPFILSYLLFTIALIMQPPASSPPTVYVLIEAFLMTFMGPRFSCEIVLEYSLSVSIILTYFVLNIIICESIFVHWKRLAKN